jgi:SpoIID/LytB domain protein
MNLTTEEGAREWIMGNPEAFCNTNDKKILSQVLNDYDQETIDFYRWKVVYRQEELTALVARHAPQLGKIIDLIPLKRGVSGRIYELKIVGENKSIIIGKELEIRKWLSNSHLYSSAFVVEKDGDTFTLYGAGWGHGVGLCQIGAAVMAEKGYTYKEILAHYYPNTELLPFDHLS